MSGAVPKIVCLCLKFARSFFGCPQFGGKTVGKIHGSVAVCLRQIRRLLHQGDNPASSATIVAFGGPFLGSNAITEVDVSSAWTRIIAPFPQRNLAYIVNTMQGLFWREVGAFQRKLWQSSPHLGRSEEPERRQAA